ncbi:MAG: HD-GYP domain-containing protein [Desulfurivibrionaceae bacterium]
MARQTTRRLAMVLSRPNRRFSMHHAVNFFKLPATFLIYSLVLLFTLSSSYFQGLNVLSERGVETFTAPILVGFVLASFLSFFNFLREKKKRKETRFFLQTIESLAMALDERDQYTHGHARRVTNLSLILADRLKLQSQDKHLLRLSGILHDIGKVGVPDEILLKPDRLSEDEFALIKKHPDKGVKILEPMLDDENISKISKAIKHHHERYDGNGYPDGLGGGNIPLLARIIALADSYDAMTSDRPYRKGLPQNKAIAEIEKGRGTQFDPFLSGEFVSLLEETAKTPCPAKQSCEIFGRIANSEISKAFDTQYCSCFYNACARYKIKDKKQRSPYLCPDGSFLIKKR